MSHESQREKTAQMNNTQRKKYVTTKKQPIGTQAVSSRRQSQKEEMQQYNTPTTATKEVMKKHKIKKTRMSSVAPAFRLTSNTPRPPWNRRWSSRLRSTSIFRPWSGVGLRNLGKSLSIRNPVCRGIVSIRSQGWRSISNSGRDIASCTRRLRLSTCVATILDEDFSFSGPPVLDTNEHRARSSEKQSLREQSRSPQGGISRQAKVSN